MHFQKWLKKQLYNGDQKPIAVNQLGYTLFQLFSWDEIFSYYDY